MMTEALIGKLKHIQARLADLIIQRKFTEMSDDRAFSNGRLASFDRDISQTQTELAGFLKQHPVQYGPGDTKLAVECLNGKTFGFTIHDFSRPGVLKKLAVTLTDEELNNLKAYLGNEMVTYNGYQCDAAIAFHMLDQRFKTACEEIGRLRRENAEMSAQMEMKFGEGT